MRMALQVIFWQTDVGMEADERLGESKSVERLQYSSVVDPDLESDPELIISDPDPGSP
jgi:hypothetical protein